MPDLRVVTWIDETGDRLFDVRDYAADDGGWGEHFGCPVDGPWKNAPGWGVEEAELREFLAKAVGFGWSPAKIDAAIAAAIADEHGRE